MDKSWMQEPDRFSEKYVRGVRDFIRNVKQRMGPNNNIRCPCSECLNIDIRTIDDVEDHLFFNGISSTYIYHKERSNYRVYDNVNDVEEDGDEAMPDKDEEEGDEIQEMLEDVRRGAFIDTTPMDERDNYNLNDLGERDEKHFEKLLGEAERQLYPNCTKFSTLSFLVKLLHLKIINRWSNKSFDMLLELLKEAFPSGETLPKSHYEARSILRDLGLGYVSIHACKNDCALFWKELEDKQECPICGESRWKINDGKGKRIPHKILRYFSLKQRLQRLFMSRKNAEDMRWHSEKRSSNDNFLRHPADSEAWKDFDKEHEWFSQEPRNIRLGLASDGFNPFGNMHNSYSMWPVILMPYNLPPWKCMKEPFLMMSLLIPGPQAPGKDIDVYLRPLIDELKELWEFGVKTYDASTGKSFQMHAAVLWTINDFPAYANLSGWSTKGYMACPTCNEHTISHKLRSKICYIGHRRYLPPNHSWQKSKKFNGRQEHRSKPLELSGDDVLQQLNRVKDYKPGKHSENRNRKRAPEELNWTKKSIFFELPYWRTLKLRHNLDVMHIEKNICESVLGTLLNIEGKTKDTYKARQDLEDMKIRKELHLKRHGDTYKMPPACFTLSKLEKQGFCEFLKLVKFPDGYASNISRCVSVSDGKVSGLKSHDCHVLLQRLLPVGIRGFLSKDVNDALVELGKFFKDLCCKTLKVEELERLERDIILILCKLEMIYPPAFFDIMVHLAIHLPREALLAGPVQYRWMYPIERYLGTLKGYVRNKAHPEGSIAEAYIVNECLTFCSVYLHGIETKFNRPDRNYDGELQEDGLDVFSQKVRPFGAFTYDFLTETEQEMTQWYVLNNCEKVEPYIDEHMKELENESPLNIEDRHRRQFPRWFMQRIKRLYSQKSVEVTDQLYALACGPDIRARKYSCCIVNGVRFHTKERDSRRKSQNSGLVVKGGHDDIEINFYGVLTNIIELEYIKGNRAIMFECEWFEADKKKKAGIQIDDHFTSINVNGRWYKNDPYVLAVQAKQVFYLNDTKFGNNWKVVQEFQHRHLYDPEVEKIDIDLNEVADDVVYQESEPSEFVGIIQLDQNFSLDRNDVDPHNVDIRVIHTTKDAIFNETDFINDENADEDETLAEYYDNEEDFIETDHDDSDID